MSGRLVDMLFAFGMFNLKHFVLTRGWGGRAGQKGERLLRCCVSSREAGAECHRGLSLGGKGCCSQPSCPLTALQLQELKKAKPFQSPFPVC